MNNLFSYCGLVDARISASEKDLPVSNALNLLAVANPMRPSPIIPMVLPVREVPTNVKGPDFIFFQVSSTMVLNLRIYRD